MNKPCDSKELNTDPVSSELRDTQDLLVLLKPSSLRQYCVEQDGRIEIMVGGPLADSILRSPASTIRPLHGSNTWPLDFEIE